VQAQKTREEWANKTTDARRESRYKFAEARIRKIVDGAPPLTAEQRDKLATLLRSA
jgi:hypothetical protein